MKFRNATLLFFLLSLWFQTQAQFDSSGNSVCYTQKFKPDFGLKSNIIDTCTGSLDINVSYQGKPFAAYWSDGETSINRKITYSGSYQLYLYDSLKCIDTSVTLQVTLKGNPIYVYTAEGNNEVTLCSGNSVRLYAYHFESIIWNTGDSSSYIVVDKGGKYYAKSKNNANCVVTSDTLVVTEVSPTPISIKITGDSIFCLNDSCTLEANTNDSNIYWMPYYDYGKKITVTKSGLYYVYTKDTKYGCDVKSQQINIQVKTPEAFTMCMVTNDSGSGKNKLVWEPKSWVSKYQVYRETNVFGEFELLAELNGASNEYYIDTNSKPRTRPYTYYVDAFDSCGNAAAENKYYRHTTLHLTANLGVSGENNLNWSDYYGIYPINTYNIYRSNEGKPYQKIASVSASVKSYSDFEPPTGSNRYFIEIDATMNCNTSQSTNLVSNTVAFGILADESITTAALSISPNPTKDYFFVNGLPSYTSVNVYTLTGVFLGSLQPQDNSGYKIAHLNAGIYLIETPGNKIFKLIKE